MATLLSVEPRLTMCYAHLSPQAMLEAVNVVRNVVGNVVGNVVVWARVGRPVTAANQPQAAVATA